jgi:hypothetical protein
MEVTMRFFIRVRDDGRYEVFDVQTGQIRFVGVTPHGARYAQAVLNQQELRRNIPR